MLEKIKKYFKISYFGTVTLRDGTEITVDGDTEVGAAVTVLPEGSNEPIAVPDGEYILEDGTIMIIEGGLISELREETPEEETPEEEMESEVDGNTGEVKTEETTETTETVEEDSKEETVEEEDLEINKILKDLQSKMKSLEEKVAETTEMKKDFQSLKEKLEETDGAVKLSKVKKEVELSPSDKRFESIKNRLKS